MVAERLVFGARVNWAGHLKAKVKIRNFPEITLDEGNYFKGENLGPNPGEVLLASVGGCLVMTFSYLAQKMKVPLEGLTIDLEGAVTKPEGAWRITELRASLAVEADPSRTPAIKELFEKFKWYCPITQSVIKGIPIEFDLKINDAEH